jgi:hypothetical protein
MSSPQVQEWRKGETIAPAVESIKGPKPDTQGLDEALEEPLLPNENKLAAIVAELVESVDLRAIQRGGGNTGLLGAMCAGIQLRGE